MENRITLWEYALIRAGLQAQQQLLERAELNPLEIRRLLTLVRLGRETVERLERSAADLYKQHGA